MRSSPLRPLVLVTAISGVVAVLLFALLSVPVEDPFADEDPDVAAAASTAIAWTVAKILAVVSAAAGLLLLGLAPVVTALGRVLTKQEALERKLNTLESRRTEPATELPRR